MSNNRATLSAGVNLHRNAPTLSQQTAPGRVELYDESDKIVYIFGSEADAEWFSISGDAIWLDTRIPTSSERDVYAAALRSI